MGDPFFTQTVSGKWQIEWIKMSSRLTLLFASSPLPLECLGTVGDAHTHTCTDTGTLAQGQLAPGLPTVAQAVQSWWRPPARLGAAYLLLPWQVRRAAASAEGPLPGCLLQISSSLPFSSPLLCLFPFPSASQRTWALSFSIPEAGVRFYNVDPLQKARSICLISWRSLDSSIACCLCSCINHRALPRSEGQSSAISTLNLTSNYINRYLSPPWWRQRALKWKGFLWLVHWQKFLNEIIQVWETYWPLTMIGQINTRKET